MCAGASSFVAQTQRGPRRYARGPRTKGLPSMNARFSARALNGGARSPGQRRRSPGPHRMRPHRQPARKRRRTAGACPCPQAEWALPGQQASRDRTAQRARRDPKDPRGPWACSGRRGRQASRDPPGSRARRNRWAHPDPRVRPGRPDSREEWDDRPQRASGRPRSRHSRG